MLRRILEWAVPRLAIAVIWVVYRTTCRFVVNWHIVEEMNRAGRHCVIASWHNTILYFAPFLGSRIGMPAIISKSKDGDAFTVVSVAFGVPAIRGSTSRGALSALRESLRALNDGHVGITPDGPRGPRYVVQDGAAALAQLSGAPVIPIAWAAASPWEFGSWDRMKLPKPFTRVVVLVGEPVWVARDEDTEAARLRIERAMRRATREADLLAGGTLTEREPLLRE